MTMIPAALLAVMVEDGRLAVRFASEFGTLYTANASFDPKNKKDRARGIVMAARKARDAIAREVFGEDDRWFIASIPWDEDEALVDMAEDISRYVR